MTKKDLFSAELRKIAKDCFLLAVSFFLLIAFAYIYNARHYRLAGSEWVILAQCLAAYMIYDIIKLIYQMSKAGKTGSAEALSQSRAETSIKAFTLSELREFGKKCVQYIVIVLVIKIASDTILHEDYNIMSFVIAIITTCIYCAVSCACRILRYKKIQKGSER